MLAIRHQAIRHQAIPPRGGHPPIDAPRTIATTLWRYPSQIIRAIHPLAVVASGLLPSVAVAAPLPVPLDLEATPMGPTGGYAVDVLWTLVAAVLVFWMQAGFAMIEAGFSRAKNVINILKKNLMDVSLGSLAFWAVGFGLMFGTSYGWFGRDGFFLSGYEARTDTYSFLLFQTVFCATAATIVSGAMAERTRFASYLIYSVCITAFIYPVFGAWSWGSLFAGNGWLEGATSGPLYILGLPPFIDFAGSTVVHSVGGWAALAGAMMLGPRVGKFGSDGHPRPILGHSMPLVILGGFVLWMGWFGFNAGSTGGVTGSANDPFAGTGKAVGLIAVNTHLAACAGAASAMFTSWKLNNKPDIGLTVNGALGGLVAITAGCAFVTPVAAIIMGGTAGVLVVASVLWLEKKRLDDPVGAISVHGVCGVWGTVGVSFFHHQGFTYAQLASQLIGIAACFAWTFTTALLVLSVLKSTLGLRIDVDSEIEGLDSSEHASDAYPPDFGSLVPAGPGEVPVGAE